jgi:hypothetical protein
VNATLDELYETVFGHPDNKKLSDSKKFDAIAKMAHELGDGETLHRLNEIRVREQVDLSFSQAMDLEDSIYNSTE